MLWRVRTNLPDRPGALATLARGCAEAGIDIRRLQVLPGRTEGEAVTDELVLDTPEDLSPDAVTALVGSAGGAHTHAIACTEAALEDQPTRYTEAARAVLAQPASFPEVVARLFDAETAVLDGPADVMELRVGDVQVQIRRRAPFTGTERQRGLAMAALVTEAMAIDATARTDSGGSGAAAPAGRGGREASEPTGADSPAGGPDGAAAPVGYVVRDDTVEAVAAGEVVGRAALLAAGEHEAELREVELAVDLAWRRRGIGIRLLGDAARLARRLGATELLVRTRADNQAVVPMILAAGMRGRIRMAGEELTVRIPLRDIRPLAP